MKYLSFLVILCALLIGCSGSTSPITPSEPDFNTYFQDNQDSYPIVYVDRDAQATKMPPGWIPDGTLMTDDEILVYMAGHITESIVGIGPGGQSPWEWFGACMIYNKLHQMFVDINAQYPPPFTYAQFLVWWQEVHGYDVPDYQDMFPPC